MSGVYERNRQLSDYQFYTNAIEIRRKVVTLVTSASFPKSYRFVFAVPMAETAREIVHNIVKASAFYPNSESGVTERKRHLTLAVAECRQLVQDLQCAKAINLPIKIARLEELIDMLEYEAKLLKGAKKGVKRIGNGV